ncbi:DUF881 domain-containing protein (plasmid) [Cellulomonas sp. WB94]|nr:DUF881 domain-containing protein [Cellulomonas sp. WB94]
MTSRHGDSPTVRVPDASMSLLNDVARMPLEPAYRIVADQRAREGRRRVTMRHRTLSALLAVTLGLATTSAALALRAPQPAVLAARAIIEKQIAERTAAVDSLRLQNAESAQQIAALQATVLAARDSPLVDQLAADSVISGASALTGPGLRITLSDAPDVGGVVDPDRRVQDVDLQILVNGLWASGAEAIAVNDHRLTTTTAIRSAGSAILVDLNPLVGPYVVEAIGDGADLQTRLARVSAGQHLATLRTTYSIGVDVSATRSLELPAASLPELRFAAVPAGVPLIQGSTGTGTPTGSGSPSGTGAG